MRIKNLYLNLLVKVKEPEEKEIKHFMASALVNEKMSNSLSDDLKEDIHLFINLKPDEGIVHFQNKEQFENYYNNVKYRLTKFSSQMRKLKNFPVLDHFVRQNIDNIDEFGRAIILKEKEFKQLCADSKLGNDLPDINIMFDTNVVFCKIIKINKESLAMALAQKTITVEKYDELMNFLDPAYKAPKTEEKVEQQ
jgi:hypothetical protein